MTDYDTDPIERAVGSTIYWNLICSTQTK